jgi:transposase
LLDVEQWAQIRRMNHVEGLRQREIHRRTGIHRDTIRRAPAQAKPTSDGPRPRRPSMLDPFVASIEELLGDEPRLSGVRIRDEITALGYEGSKTISWRNSKIPLLPEAPTGLSTAGRPT